MTLNLPAGAITDAATISPLALFLQADIVVKGVMIGLLLAIELIMNGWMLVMVALGSRCVLPQQSP